MTLAKSSLWVSAGALLSLGCSTVEVRPDLQRVEIAHAVFLTLPDAEEITERINATQLLVADYGDRSFSFEVELEIRPGMITIASVNMWGGTLFAVTYDGLELRTRGAIDAEGFDAEFLLGDVLLTYWSSDWLSARLQGAVLEDAHHSPSRTLLRGGEPVIEISYESANRWAGRTHFKHREREYELNIHTVGFSGS